MKQKKDLLVTLADRNYIAQAKQLFSSVYHNAGWQGDYLLLAHQIPEKELKWFRDKGILVRKTKLLLNKSQLKTLPENHNLNWNSVTLTKLNLFTPYFKKWNNLVFLDSDILVRASLNNLTKVKGFAAVRDYFLKLKYQFSRDNLSSLKELEKKYDLKEPPFNSGVMAFSTNIIKNNTEKELKEILSQYKKINLWGDQGILNLYFYKKWKKLPAVYNTYSIMHGERDNSLHFIIYHSIGKKKIWRPSSGMYKEWKSNLDKADLIDLKRRPKAKSVWSKKEINKYERVINLKIIYNLIKNNLDFNIGLVGIKIKKASPKLYKTLKSLK